MKVTVFHLPLKHSKKTPQKKRIKAQGAHKTKSKKKKEKRKQTFKIVCRIDTAMDLWIFPLNAVVTVSLLFYKKNLSLLPHSTTIHSTAQTLGAISETALLLTALI